MREETEVEIVTEEIAVVGSRIKVKMTIVVDSGVVEQNERLPHVLEEEAVQAGQAFMREYYRQRIEYADMELVMSQRRGKEGKGIQLIGRKQYSFKTRFGTVKVRRIRIKNKSDNSTQVPSHKIWGTPKKELITEGLKKGVCSIVVKQSFKSTVRQLEESSGEKKLLSKSSVGKILHQTGARISEAAKKRAE